MRAANALKYPYSQYPYAACPLASKLQIKSPQALACGDSLFMVE
jgi:hypothetical protein